MKKKNKLNNKEKTNVIFTYLREYRNYFMKKQILIFVVSLVIFLIAFSIGMSTIDFKAPLQKEVSTLANVKLLEIGHIFAIVASLFLALIPFIKKLSIVVIFYAYYMAFNVANMFYMQSVNKNLLAISVILSLFALSIDITFSFEISERVCKKFNSIIKKDKKDNNKEIKENKNISNSMLIITFVLFMILSIINLIIIKFI